MKQSVTAGCIVRVFDGHRILNAVIVDVDHEKDEMTVRPLAGEPQTFVVAKINAICELDHVIGFEFKRPISIVPGNDWIN